MGVGLNVSKLAKPTINRKLHLIKFSLLNLMAANVFEYNLCGIIGK